MTANGLKGDRWGLLEVPSWNVHWGMFAIPTAVLLMIQEFRNVTLPSRNIGQKTQLHIREDVNLYIRPCLKLAVCCPLSRFKPFGWLMLVEGWCGVSWPSLAFFPNNFKWTHNTARTGTVITTWNDFRKERNQPRRRRLIKGDILGPACDVTSRGGACISQTMFPTVILKKKYIYFYRFTLNNCDF